MNRKPAFFRLELIAFIQSVVLAAFVVFSVLEVAGGAHVPVEGPLVLRIALTGICAAFFLLFTGVTTAIVRLDRTLEVLCRQVSVETWPEAAPTIAAYDRNAINAKAPRAAPRLALGSRLADG